MDYKKVMDAHHNLTLNIIDLGDKYESHENRKKIRSVLAFLVVLTGTKTHKKNELSNKIDIYLSKKFSELRPLSQECFDEAWRLVEGFINELDVT